MTYHIFKQDKKIATLKTSAFGETLNKIVSNRYGIMAVAVFVSYHGNEEEEDYEEHEMISILN